jgi:hypothetical protein
VAGQSVAALAAVLEPAAATGHRELALLAVFSWSVGVFLYAAAGTFVAATLMFYELGPQDLTQPHWVSTGATAITVVAGAQIAHMTGAPVGCPRSGSFSMDRKRPGCTWGISGPGTQRWGAATSTTSGLSHPVSSRLAARPHGALLPLHLLLLQCLARKRPSP